MVPVSTLSWAPHSPTTVTRRTPDKINGSDYQEILFFCSLEAATQPFQHFDSSHHSQEIRIRGDESQSGLFTQIILAQKRRHKLRKEAEHKPAQRWPRVDRRCALDAVQCSCDRMEEDEARRNVLEVQKPEDKVRRGRRGADVPHPRISLGWNHRRRIA
jgi:hypothetical protein